MSRSSLRMVILVTGLITAAVHLVVLNIGFIEENGRPDVLFSLNGLGYLALLAAFWLRPSFLANRGVLFHYGYISFTGITIVAWLAVGARSLTGFATKLDELILIYALFAHLRAARGGNANQSQAPGS
jgi:hypothetical protein